MKNILIILLLTSVTAKAQDSTIIENLQLRARTIKILAQQSLVSNDTAITRVFFRWRGQFIPTPPADNANVTIAECPTTIVAWMYERLMNLPGGLNDAEDYINDFVTSILSKRNTNSYLDRLCDELELRYSNEMINMKAQGLIFLTQQ